MGKTTRIIVAAASATAIAIVIGCALAPHAARAPKPGVLADRTECWANKAIVNERREDEFATEAEAQNVPPRVIELSQIDSQLARETLANIVNSRNHSRDFKAEYREDQLRFDSPGSNALAHAYQLPALAQTDESGSLYMLCIKDPNDGSIKFVCPDSHAAIAWDVRDAGPAIEELKRRHARDVNLLASLQPGEELWIIQKPSGAPAAADPNLPGTGELRAVREDGLVPLPLQHTDVDAAIFGYIATVDVTQQYENPFDEKIEAIYVFPLPQNAAVNEFLMTVGERTIRGIIREREEAEAIYAAAQAQGHVASLLTQERPNLFTQKVANIEPGHRIDIQITYLNTLAYADGWYEFVFPMVVGPRFNPPGSTQGVGAVALGQTGTSGQATEVEYLRPDQRSGHDIGLEVDIAAGVEIEEIDSRNHEIAVLTEAPEHMRVKLNPADGIPNKDFVLRYKVAGQRIKTAFLTHRDERGGYFTLMLFPPAELRDLTRAPMEMVFVLDCSGSMNGQPIAQAKAAVLRALECMRPDDTFQVIRFSNNASAFGPDPVPATPENVRRAKKYVEKLAGSGGTMMIEGIKAALDFPHDPRRIRTVAFLTDGFIGNEDEILGEIHQRLGASRIFSFGVGSSPNRFLLERMAVLGNGAVAYVGLNDEAAVVMDAYFERISHPGLTDIAIDWGTLAAADVYPARIPDLFVGRPVVLTGRFAGEAPTTIRITGQVAGEARELVLDVDPTDAAATHAGLAAVWARMKIMDLANRMMYAPDAELPQAITEIALNYSLMSAYTAFVAVDSLTVTAGGAGTPVMQAVPVPDGVKYETTVLDATRPGVGAADVAAQGTQARDTTLAADHEGS